MLAATVNDLRTRLTIDTVTTDANGTRRSASDAAFPRRVALGAAWAGPRGWQLSFDAESTRGRYGKSHIDLRIVRLGAERASADWIWRLGAMVPLRVESNLTGRLRTPFPLGPTAGLGWRAGRWQLNAAVYAHAVMSMHRDRPVLAADADLTWRW